MDEDRIVHEGTRRIVGRATLRRLHGLVQDWQAEEKAKAALARRLIAGLAVAAIIVGGLFTWFYR